MKVAYIGTRGIPASYGGTEHYVERLAHHLAACGDEVVVYCSRSASKAEKANADRSVPSGVTRLEVPTIPTKHLDNFVRSFLSTLHVCADRSVEIVQMNNAGPAFFCFLPRLFGKKTVGAIRAVDSRRSKWGHLAQAFLRFCDYLIATVPHEVTVNSRSMQQYYLSRYRREATYIPNGVVLPSFRPASQIRRFGLGHRDYILFAARLEPEKGCHTLIEAFRLLDQGHGLKLVIAGHPGKSDDYARTLQAQESATVRFVGFLSGDALDELYSNAFAFVLPSSIEGMSNSLLSAMAHAIPVIVSDIPENVEVLDGAQGGETFPSGPGLTFRLGDPSDLAHNLQLLIDDPSGAEIRGQLLRDHAGKQFSLESMCQKTRDLYAAVLGR